MNDDERKKVSSGWLGHLDASLTNLILERGRLVQLNDSEVVYRLGQPQDCLYGIVSGTIRMWVTMNEQDPRFGHVAGPGFWFGETEVVTGEAGIIETMTAGETTLLSLNRTALDAIAKDHPGLWPALTLLAVQNQGLAIGAADDLMLRNTTQRLAAVLLRLSSRRNAFQGVPPLRHIPANWNELSEAASMSRSKVAVILSEFASANLIRTRQRWIEIVDAKGLENVLKRPAAK